ncbi:YfzA family protein [Virgibacillus alimentarius]|uniref:YfzA family protein n=1 Tax=Virgibacillus alimentarius TaxID=698769 RepID=UPI0004934C3D|nr:MULTISPECIES: YfzA family protein [Virgibacillus]HLR68470.1 YfzA family protein [Virgibacillus sp.]
MTDEQKKGRLHRIRWWIIALSVFFIVQLIFFTIDGTSLEPNLNDSDNIVGKYADWLLESRLFNEWITLYSFPWFNLATILFVIFLLANAVTDIFSIKEIKQRRG